MVDQEQVHPEQVAERARVAAEANPVALVDDAAVRPDQQRAATVHIGHQMGRVDAGNQVQRGNEHGPVPGQLGARPREVGGHAGPPERPVPAPYLVEGTHVHAGLR